jgi:L-alanine-DL-glutamate epimerase-like enolase superfamily enzyme
MAIIESISVATARVPLDVATSFATRTVSARDYGLVKVRAGGVDGIGFCYAGSSGGTLVAHAVENLLAPILLGRDSLLVEGLWQRMFEETVLHGRAGSVMRRSSARSPPTRAAATTSTGRRRRSSGRKWPAT